MKPDDWDDEEDGEWEPPQIGNSTLTFFIYANIVKLFLKKISIDIRLCDIVISH